MMNSKNQKKKKQNAKITMGRHTDKAPIDDWAEY